MATKGKAAGCALYHFDLTSGHDITRIDLRLNTYTPISSAKFTYGNPDFFAKQNPNGIRNVALFEVGRDNSGKCVVVQTTGFMDSETIIEQQPQLLRFHLDNPPDNFEVIGMIAMDSSGKTKDPDFTRLSYGYERLGVTVSKEIAVLPPSYAGLYYKIAGPHEPRTQTLTFPAATPRPPATPLPVPSPLPPAP
jgi:hypothetical protein